MPAFSQVLERLPVPVVLLDLESGCVAHLNEVARDRLDPSGEAPVPLAAWLARVRLTDEGGLPLPPGSSAPAQVAAGRWVTGQEVWQDGPDGRVCWLASGSPLPVLSRQPRLGLVSFHDVTALRTASADQRRRERALRSLHHSLSITDPTLPDDPIVYVNPAFERLTGYSSSEVLGRNCRLLQGPGSEGPELDRLRAALRAGEGTTVVLLNRRRDGTAFWNELTVSPVQDDDGRLTGFVGVQVDVTDRMREAVVQAEEHEGERSARREAEQAQARLSFLSEASAALDESLSVPTVLDRLTGTAVRGSADWAVVDLVDGGTARRESAAHRDPDLASVVRLFRVHSPVPALVQDVLRTGWSLHVDDAPLSAVVGPGPDHGQDGLARELGHGDVLLVPLRSRGQVLGVLSLVSATPGRFGPDDLQLAEELARRAGVAVANAQVFGERDRVARVLQASLLPPSVPRWDGLRLAARYLPAGSGAEVGGDFYDLFDTRTGHAVVIGDVCGRGPDAAAVTGLARYSTRALAMQDRPPAAVLRLVNEAVLAEGIGDRFVTVAVAVLEPVTASGTRVTLALGGHPPAVVVRRDGEVTLVGVAGTLLGLVEEVELTDVEVDLAPGDLLVLYTDGVLEAAGPDGLFGEERLTAALATAAGRGPEAAADAVVEAVTAYAGARAGDDDVAVVVVEVTGA